jgi:four helix bundle protein
MAFKFEDLRVWQLAIEFTDDVYLLTEKFPRDEMFGLSSQIKRAANSVSLNIAEGATGNSNPEFRRFLMMASRSCAEVISCLYLAKRRKYINQDEFAKVYSKTESIFKMINKLKSTIK